MDVYIPWDDVMMNQHVNPKDAQVAIDRMKQTKGFVMWIRLDIDSNTWTAFMIDEQTTSKFTWHVGTVEDYTNLQLIIDKQARYEYAKHYCTTRKVIHGHIHPLNEPY